ncbi:MAG: hypothetical protein C0507_13785 [Cyanobacteria bacterium PR.3.49]|jgi:hypothetical protein|nr:hypothetical protein [Cyanobacteria bacterium PR.3.49]
MGKLAGIEHGLQGTSEKADHTPNKRHGEESVSDVFHKDELALLMNHTIGMVDFIGCDGQFSAW